MYLPYKKTILCTLVVAGITVFYAGYSERSQAKVAFLDIGQGDAIFVGFPDSTQILIDGGPDEGAITAALGRHMPLHDRTIELVVLTHPHADHVRGLNAVFSRYNVLRVLVTGVRYESNTYSRFLDSVKAEGASVYHVEAGDRVFWRGRPILEIHAPRESLLGETMSDVNQSSIVATLTLGGLRFLLTGDVEEPVEKALLAANAVADIDVLKVSHSGARRGTNAEFLAAVRPETAVISVGENSYGHPHPNVLGRLEALGSKVLRTDQHGDIVWTFKTR